MDPQKSGNSFRTSSLADLGDHFVTSVKVTDAGSFSHVLSSLVASWWKDEMAARTRIKPFICFLEACAAALRSETAKTPDAHLRALNLAELREVINAWPKLSPELRAACRATKCH
jgi:ATP adenylyltransferase/5',5'''-P-1,P-4-tetraphosphate phosphorylase II